MSLLKLSQSREKASTIVDIFKSVASGKVSNADGIRGIKNALKELSSEQVKSIATSGSFEKATARNLMSLKGLDKEVLI